MYNFNENPPKERKISIPFLGIKPESEKKKKPLVDNSME